MINPNYQIRIQADVQTEEQQKKLVTQMNQLRKHIGWKHLSRDLESLKEELKSDIFKVGMNEVKYSEKDLLILFHSFVQQVLDHPKIVIKLLTDNEMESFLEDHDPFN